MDRMTGGRALVLGGGGVTGIAWELGVITALAERGVVLRDAELIVGTSAGSTVGAQITSGRSLDELEADQRTPADQGVERAVELDIELLTEIFAELADEDGDANERRARIGAMAIAAPTIPVAERHEIIDARLRGATWPAVRLAVTAIDAESGELAVFESSSGVTLVDAVAASCAVPGVWPPVPIGTSRYIDGGVRSATNADLAAGADLVLVLSPMVASMTPQLDRSEVGALEADGSAVIVLRVDEDAVEAMGPNPLDPAMRDASFDAGYRQGEAVADDLAEIWNGTMS